MSPPHNLRLCPSFLSCVEAFNVRQQKQEVVCFDQQLNTSPLSSGMDRFRHEELGIRVSQSEAE